MLQALELFASHGGDFLQHGDQRLVMSNESHGILTSALNSAEALCESPAHGRGGTPLGGTTVLEAWRQLDPKERLVASAPARNGSTSWPFVDMSAAGRSSAGRTAQTPTPPPAVPVPIPPVSVPPTPVPPVPAHVEIGAVASIRSSRAQGNTGGPSNSGALHERPITVHTNELFEEAPRRPGSATVRAVFVTSVSMSIEVWVRFCST